jgi:hypothetical protein
MDLGRIVRNDRACVGINVENQYRTCSQIPSYFTIEVNAVVGW